MWSEIKDLPMSFIDEFSICDLRREKDKILTYLNKVDAGLIDHVTLNQPPLINKR